MHDRNGTPLKVGDRVVIEGTITQLNDNNPNYCNVSVQTVVGRRPDGAKETLGAINTGTLALLSRD